MALEALGIHWEISERVVSEWFLPSLQASSAGCKVLVRVWLVLSWQQDPELERGKPSKCQSVTCGECKFFQCRL